MINEEKQEEIKEESIEETKKEVESQTESKKQEVIKRRKSILLNTLLVFIICFLCTFSFFLFQDYEYYSVYSKEDLAEFFSMKKTVLWDLKQALTWSVMQLIIYVPIVDVLEKRNIKIWKKLLIILPIVAIITFVFIMLNLSITF